MSTNQRDSLRAAIANATSWPEQVAAVTALDEFDTHQAAAHKTAASNDWADTTIRQTLSPVAVHERSTIATDWLGEAKTASAGPAHAAMAEAAMWFGRTSAEVRSDVEEFGIQAEGFMRREASKYGESMDAVYSQGLSYLGFLHRQAASGLDQIQQTVNPHEDAKTTPLDPAVFDNFADEVHPINAGVVGTETSERNPLLQEIEQEGAGQGQAEVEGGHSTDNQPTGPAPQFGNTDAASGDLGYAHAVRSVALNHSMTLDDFIQAEGASGLDQVQQVVDPHEDPKPTPLNTEVQFPWLIGPDAYGNGGEKHTGSRLPFAREAAGYDDHYQQGHDSSGRYGQPTQFRDHEDADDRAEQWGGDQFSTHDLSRGEWEHSQDNPGSSSADQSAFLDGWTDRSSGNDNMRRQRQTATLQTQADMFGNSDNPHAVPGVSPANNPGTTPNPGASYAEGQADALAGDRPTFADASSHAPDNVQQYSHGYGDGAQERKEQGSPAKDFPSSLGGDNGTADSSSAAMSGASSTTASASSPAVIFHENFGNVTRAQLAAYRKHNVSPSDHDYLAGQYGEDNHSGITQAVKDPANHQGSSFSSFLHGQNEEDKHWASKRSSLFTQASTRETTDFTKGYRFLEKWASGKPLVTTGSPQFEAGLFAALVDNPVKSEAWRAAHRRQAAKDEQFGHRIAAYDGYADALAEQGIDITAAVEAKNTSFGTQDACSKCSGDIEYVGHRSDPAKEFLKVDRGSGWWDRGGNFSCPSGGTHERGKTAATSTDLDTTDLAVSPAADGTTPINGPGTVPPLAGGTDPARSGGPAPYNAAAPGPGTPVVPAGPPVPSQGAGYISDVPGGPADGNSKAFAFRRQVQAGLLAINKQRAEKG